MKCGDRLATADGGVAEITRINGGHHYRVVILKTTGNQKQGLLLDIELGYDTGQWFPLDKDLYISAMRKKKAELEAVAAELTATITELEA